MRLRRAALAHPLLAVLATALAVRVAFALVTFAVNQPVLVGDEQQYLNLARTVASGRSADDWFEGYGQSLYNSSRAFMAPLTFVVHYLGPDRLVGSFLAAAAGAACAVGTTAIARRLASDGWAVAAGLVVALMPSQVLWSSIVLRESFIWLGLVLVGLAVSITGRRPLAAAAAAALGAIGLLALGATRSQTELVAAWAVLGAAVLLVRARPAVAAALVLVALVVPVVSGLGVAGYRLASEGSGSLGRVRTGLGLGADTALDPTTVIGKAAKPRATADDSHGGALAMARRNQVVTVTLKDGRTRQALQTPDGTLYAFDDSSGATISALPRGVVATLARPFPWESGDNALSRLAAVENLIWLVLYALAVLGLVVVWRAGATAAYPALVVAGIVGLAALTQGNVGTAFRHRGQILWALAVLAAPGAEWLVARARRGLVAAGAATAGLP